jgi:hypothetical protein
MDEIEMTVAVSGPTMDVVTGIPSEQTTFLGPTFED